jgi:hypothetical protein
LRSRAAVGVMNVAVAGNRQPASAYLCLGLGQRIAAGRLAEPARFPWEKVEGDPAAAVYERRMPAPWAGVTSEGRSSPSALLQLQWPAFLNGWAGAGPIDHGQQPIGMGEVLRLRGGASWIGVGKAAENRYGALVALDAAAIVPLAITASSVAPRLVRSCLNRTSLVVIDLPADFAADLIAALIRELSLDREVTVALVSPYPRPDPGGKWGRLPPLLLIGPGFHAGLLSSATTRTRGLVANIDVAPTLLTTLRAPVPGSMVGRPMVSEAPPSPGEALRLATRAELAERAVVPLGIGVGAAAVVPLVLTLVGYWERHWARGAAASDDSAARAAHLGRSRRLLSLARGSLLYVASAPLGLLLCPLLDPRSVAEMAVALALCCGLTVAAVRLIRATRPRALLWIYVVTALVVALDTLCGDRLVARSPLSGYAVAGLRYYGLGNEYTGFLVGMGLLAPLMLESRLHRLRWLQGCWYLALLLLVGSPAHGADFGGALTAAATFACALTVAARPRRPWMAAGAVIGAGAAVGFGVLIWDALRPAPLRSHMGDFARAVAAGGWSAAAPVLERKAAMNARLISSAYALVPIAGVAPLLGLWYHDAGRWLHAQLSNRPELRSAIAGSLVGSWIALLCNDSGIVPWLFITATMLVLLLDEQLRTDR